MFRTSWLIVALVFVVVSSGCSKGGKKPEPVEVLESYVKIAINAKAGEERANLFEYTTGKALAGLKQMTDEEFLEFLVKPEYKFVHFSTRDSHKEMNGALSLVYELVYESVKGNTTAKITSRKIAYFSKDSAGNWRISDTRNLKTFLEMKEGLKINFKFP